MNKQIAEIINSWLHGFQNNYSLFSQPIIKNLNFYNELISTEYSDLVFIIHPDSQQCNTLYSLLRSNNFSVCNLGEHLFPTQSRELISQLADGKYKICLITPEVFVYWFKQIINENNNLEPEKIELLQNIIKRLTHIVYCDIAMALPSHSIYKEKYRAVLELSKRLPVKNLFLGTESSLELETLLINYFQEVEHNYMSLVYSHVALHVQYEFSRQKQLEKLAKLLEKSSQSTIVYLQESSQETLYEISQYLEKRNITHKSYTDNLSTEVKAEVLEYYLEDKVPNLLINCNPENLPQHSYNLSRIIYYAAPDSISNVYNTISFFQESLKDIYFIVSEDNLVEVHAEAIQQKKLINKREKVKINYINRRKQFIQFFTENKLCLWQVLEQLLINKQIGQECNICDTCTHVKRSAWAKLSMLFLRLRKRVKHIG